MSNIIEGAKLGLKAAILDVSKNMLDPIHNLRVAFGLEHEESLEEMVKKETKNNHQPMPQR